MDTGGVPVDWHRSSFSSNFHALYFEEGGEEKVDLALSMLESTGTERVLDLACATGRRTLELCRRGFNAIGVDIRPELLEVAGGEAEIEDLYPYFVEVDPREIGFEDEFDIVLSLGGGAFGHFGYDEENLEAFRAAARALRPGGRLLMQIPNVLHVEQHLPERTWVAEEMTLDIVEQHWNADTRCIDGRTISLVAHKEMDEFECATWASFQRRLYSIEELAQIFESVGLCFADVFDEHGQRCTPTDLQQEIYVEAHA